MGSFASACFFGLLAVFSMIYYRAAAWFFILGLSCSLGVVLWKWLKKEAHLGKEQRLLCSLGLAIIIFLLGWMVMAWVPLTVTGQSQSAPQKLVVEGWGKTGACAARINGESLLEYKDKFGVAVICGITNSMIDRFEDQKITVTPIFTIVKSRIDIQSVYRKEMADAIQELNKAVESLPPHQRQQAKENITIQFWIEAVLLPKSVNPADIHKLSDVERYGGKTFSD